MDEVLNSSSTGIYQIREANQMIEEFMLAANISVAEKILKHFPLCSLLRYTFVQFLLSHPDHVKTAHIQRYL